MFICLLYSVAESFFECSLFDADWLGAGFVSIVINCLQFFSNTYDELFSFQVGVFIPGCVLCSRHVCRTCVRVNDVEDFGGGSFGFCIL